MRPPRSSHGLIYEDDVVNAVMAHLQERGWTIESYALADQRGDDIVAVRGTERLVVEAKGEGSSKTGTARYGLVFTGNQVKTHVSVAIVRAMRVVSSGTATSAVAFPANDSHRSQVAQVALALRRLGIRVYWVSHDGNVSTDP